MKALHRIFAFLLVPFLGYLLGATIFNFFWDKAEPGDLAKADMVAVAKSCERKGPVALRGFGYYYDCKIERRFKDGDINTSTVTGWLDPSDIGKEYAAHNVRRSQPAPDERPQVFVGWLCTFVYGMLFMYVWAKIAVPAFADRFRQMPEPQEPLAT
ncbi:DUF6346 domain-containing protein [Lentzea sp. BCCO 10_0061]|uniref:DUF6346 domain-containing protein n=1 Tax=Lentzea sokolovensis TaxID=3095429 RepID=A0ABU4UNM5_9PSEU|nr:DUF6346 domain-containing protein [Lentzea sp. BCCO 10_0061]MDX8141103.1 DUF6346 domain-containing protein [Lentzea sp. BCCO 10_0061]